MQRPITDKTFCQVFPDYDIFKEWYISLPLSKNGDCPNEVTYSLILYQYCDSHIAYSEEGFKMKFAKQLYTYYKEFENTSKAIDELMNLTDEEVSVANISTLNNADTPETPIPTDSDEFGDGAVNYISNQQKTITRKGKMQIKREQLANKRSYTVTTFLNRFSSLFMKILGSPFLDVWGEDEDY